MRYVAGVIFGCAICAQVLAQNAPTAGQYGIGYASFAPLNGEVFVGDADGSNARPVSPDPGWDANASFSADGRWIVFTSNRQGSADIFRVHPDGSGLERLTDDPAYDDQAAMSPDGQHLAFVSTRTGHAEIWLLDLGTKALKNLTGRSGGSFRPAWSPDGAWIAFSSDRASPHPVRPGSFESIQSTEIYVMRPDGADVLKVTRTGSFAGSPSFSPDGKQLVCYQADLSAVIDISDPRRLRAATKIVRIDLATLQDKVIAEGAGEKWSPRWLASGQVGYASGGPEGGLEFVGGKPGARGSFESPSWSADGKQVVFHRETANEWPPAREEHSRDPAFRLFRTGIFPSFAPDGSRLISGTNTRALAHNGILSMPVDGTNRRVIFDDPEKSSVAAVLSPKGDKIAFGLGAFFGNMVGRPATLSNIALVNADGSNLQLLTTGDVNDGFPSWSPDGRQLVYRSAGAVGKGLRILDISTKQTKVLTDGTYVDNFPSWSPDGSTIAFTRNVQGNYDIFTIGMDGAGLRRLTTDPANEAHSTWSPDGLWIAFASGQAGFKDEMPLHAVNPQSYGEICVMRRDGSDVRCLTDNPFEDATPTWLPSLASVKVRSAATAGR
jgi:Tol biopolymer transport system component